MDDAFIRIVDGSCRSLVGKDGARRRSVPIRIADGKQKPPHRRGLAGWHCVIVNGWIGEGDAVCSSVSRVEIMSCTLSQGDTVLTRIANGRMYQCDNVFLGVADGRCLPFVREDGPRCHHAFINILDVSCLLMVWSAKVTYRVRQDCGWMVRGSWENMCRTHICFCVLFLLWELFFAGANKTNF